MATLVELAESAIGAELGELAVDGVLRPQTLLQAQADCTGLTVRRAANLESTARGVALFAGVQAGVVTDIEDLVVPGRWRIVEPQIDTSHRAGVIVETTP